MRRRRPPGLDPAFPDLPPHPTPEEEIALARRIQDGDDAAHRELVERNLRLVVPIARRYIARGATLPFADLFQEGAIGLTHAARLFDPERGFRFSTYACYWIEHMIRRACQNSGLIHLPAYIQEKRSRLDRGKESRDDLSPAARQRIDAANRTDGVVFESQCPGGDEPYLQTIVDRPESEPYTGLSPRTRALLSQLDVRSQRLLTRRYGLDGQPPLSLRQLAASEHLNYKHTSDLAMQAIHRLRHLATQREAS